jgi:beta-N-acetylhexosaminidase
MAAKSSLDLRHHVGQLLIMGFDGTAMSSKLRTTLQSLQPGGVILFARNITGAGQTWELLRACRRSLDVPPFLCVDMEGGTVDRLKNVLAPAPSAADAYATGNRKVFRRHGRIIGGEVCALGFNTDFAPCVDLAFPPSNKVLGSRVVSADPDETVAYAREFLRGLKDAHVLGCLKHFPGLGEANLDTHHELPAIDKSWKRLWAEDLHPYRALARQAAFVMIAHAAYPAVTRDRTPASISKKWIGEVLRKKVGYRGLAITDDLEMGGVQAAASVGEAAVETIKAGADIFLACHSEKVVWETCEAVYKAAERDRRFARKVTAAANRVVAFKKKSAEVKRHVPEPGAETLDRLRRELWEFAEE